MVKIEDIYAGVLLKIAKSREKFGKEVFLDVYFSGNYNFEADKGSVSFGIKPMDERSPSPGTLTYRYREISGRDYFSFVPSYYNPSVTGEQDLERPGKSRKPKNFERRISEFIPNEQLESLARGLSDANLEGDLVVKLVTYKDASPPIRLKEPEEETRQERKVPDIRYKKPAKAKATA